jgi:uroporphyrinogen-III decarboxylase
MQLSTSFTIDPGAPWVKQHNADVRAVMEAYAAKRPIRVPLLPWEWAGQHGFYADEIDLDYRDYYGDPDVMLRVQLEAARRRRELPISDIILGEAPERWPVTVDFWPIVPSGWVGCELIHRREVVIGNRHLDLDKDACDALAMPDPRDGGILATIRRFWETLRERYEGRLTFLGQPVGPITPSVGHTGIFSLALEIRGAELMMDFYEDPDFARRFLEKIATWCDTLEETWAEIIPIGAYGFSDHGIDMLSADTYEAFFVPLILEHAARRGKGLMGDLHHCGRGVQLFPVMRHHFQMRSISNLTYPLVDVPKVRRDLGEDVPIVAILDDGIIQQGPPEYIREMTRELLLGAKGRGAFALNIGDMLRGTPLEHRLVYYEAVKEFGRYE